MSEQARDEKAIFLAALDKSTPSERFALVERACAGDPALLERVKELLSSHEESKGPLDSPPPGVGASPTLSPVTERPGTVIGPYRLLQQIGEGGMGVVYMAEQTEPVERRVALKIIKPGMDSSQVISRFEQERQALAIMDHPNIAKVLDAGTTDSGRPYFVMELVKGVPITQYCDEHHLTPRQRLALFVQVCHAAQHAHQKGIIHRDIKPTNVLVAEYDDRPVPKIIDFGVAKAIQQRLTEKSVFTVLGQVVGTIDYMSPEQAKLNQLDIDTRSDIYSLGVLLYELLTGETPLDRQRLRSAAFDEMLRIIREEEPPKPSLRLSSSDSLPSIAANRQIEPKKLSTLVRGELDWIVMKALEKERSRRYETANGFAADIERYLGDEPVLACPPSVAYRLRKFVRRNKRPVAAVGLVLLALVAGIIGTTWGMIRAENARQDAILAQLAEVDRAEGERRAKGEAEKATELARQQKVEAEKASELARQQKVEALGAKELAEKAGKLARQHEELANQQRQLAQEQQRVAIAQREEAIRQRDAADYGRYVANMRLAQSDRAAGHTERLFRLLEAQAPEPGRPNLRGWEWWQLYSECHSERFALPYQFAPIAWSPDEKYLATFEKRGDLFLCANIWDVASGKRKTTLEGCPGVIDSISWSPDGKYLAAGNDRGSAVIWEIASGGTWRRLHGRAAAVYSVAWNPDSVRLACGEADGTVRIWNVQTGKVLAALAAPNGPVGRVHWHPDGKHLLVTFARVYGSANEAQIWDTTSRQVIDTWSTEFEWWAEFSPDGTRVAYGSREIIDLRTRKNVVSRMPAFRGGKVTWSPDGKRLASTTDKGPVVIWDAGTGDILSTIVTNSMPNTPPAWSPKGRFLAASCKDKTVKIWDTEAVAPLITLPMPTACDTTAAFSPDGKRLLVAPGNGTVKVVAAESGKEILSAQYAKAPDSVVRCAAWSPDGKRFAVRVDPGNVVIADAETGKQLLPLLACGDMARSLAFSPDGALLAVGTATVEQNRGRVKVFSASTGKEVATSAYSPTGLLPIGESVAWRPDGTRLAAAGRWLRIWDPAALQAPLLSQSRPPTGDCCNALCWSPDGNRLAVGTTTISIWDTSDGVPTQVLRTLEGHTTTVTTVTWHPSMPRLASGSRDGTVRIWDTSSGEEVGVVHTGTAQINTVTWSPDGLRLAWTAPYEPVRIWDASVAVRFLKSDGDLRAKASALEQTGGTQNPIDLLDRLRKLHPDEEDLQIRIHHLRWHQARWTATNGRLAAADARFRELKAEWPNMPDHRLLVPGEMLASGRVADAIEMLERAAAEFPERGEYREELAWLHERWAIQLCQSDKVPDAAPILRKLAKEFPERPSHRSELARQLTRQLPKEKALDVLQELIQEFPDASEYRQAAARCLRQAGRNQEAEALLKGAFPIEKLNHRHGR